MKGPAGMRRSYELVTITNTTATIYELKKKTRTEVDTAHP